MRKLVPIKDSVICKRVSNKDTIETQNGIQFKSNNVDLYEIIDLSITDNVDSLKIGDIIMNHSTGDEIEINPGEYIYLFKSEHIMCKVM